MPHQSLNNEVGFANVESRRMNYKPLKPLPFSQQNGRFFFNSGTGTSPNAYNVGYNPLLKTATFTITSTCTALTIVSCIAFPGAVPALCVRKREIGPGLLDEDYDTQFSIKPAEVRL